MFHEEVVCGFPLALVLVMASVNLPHPQKNIYKNKKMEIREPISQSFQRNFKFKEGARAT